MVHTACLNKSKDPPHKVYSCPQHMEGQEVLAHFLVASIHISCSVSTCLPESIGGKKSTKDCFQKERAWLQWHLPRIPAFGKLRQDSCQLWASLERFSQTQKRDGTWLNCWLFSKEEKSPQPIAHIS